MKRLAIVIACTLLLVLTQNLRATSYEFDWTANGASQYNASILYSDGTTVNGVFTPTGLLGYSFGSPFGVITPTTHYPFFAFYTDTPYGSSFNTQGTVTPVTYLGGGDPPYQEFSGDSLSLDFKDQTEVIRYFDTKVEPHINLTGIWTETIIPAPDVASSGLLLATALAALGAFHAVRRPAAGESPLNLQSKFNP